MQKKLMSLTTLFLLLPTLLVVTSCASTNVIDSCAWVKPISVSKKDVLTDQTVAEILAHNKKYETFCKD